MHKIWGADATHLYAVGGGVILFSTGNGTWTPQLTVTTEAISAVWGLSATSVYACTSGGGHILRSDGSGRWSTFEVYDPGLSVTCYDIWGTAEDDLYLATSDGVFHGTR